MPTTVYSYDVISSPMMLNEAIQQHCYSDFTPNSFYNETYSGYVGERADLRFRLRESERQVRGRARAQLGVDEASEK